MTVKRSPQPALREKGPAYCVKPGCSNLRMDKSRAFPFPQYCVWHNMTEAGVLLEVERN